MSQMLALLNEMRNRPLAIYVGTTSLSRLADFLGGYAHAIYRLLPREKDTFLSEFRDWIYRRFQTNENISWEALILRHSADEEDAVRRFWVLLDDYLQERGSQNPAATGLCQANGIGSADLSIKQPGSANRR
jgi:hypothetical protein